MSGRGASWLAWSLAGLSCVLYFASAPFYLLARSVPIPSTWKIDLSVGSLLEGAFFLVFPIVGALIASRRPENPIGWICLADGLWMLSINVFAYYSAYGVARPGSLPFALGIAGVSNWLWVPGVGLLGTFVFLLFPDGRLPSRRWRPLGWLSGTAIVVLSVGVMLAPGSLDALVGVRNPFGLEGQSWITAAAYVALPLLPLCMLASGLSLVLRYRRSVGEERQQIKWIALAASVVVIMYLIAMVGSLVHPSGSWTTTGPVLWLNLLTLAALLSFMGIPLAIGFAVLKYRLYDIDVIINRALVYAPLTATLAAVYFGGVVGLQYIFRALTSQESQLAIVVSTLAIAALFNPLRRRIQTFIDRRFYRRKYDAAKTLENFSVRLRKETDLEVLSSDLVSVVDETMQPAHVSLWLKETERARGRR